MSKVQIEVNGVKMEVDTRYATRLDTIKVGTRVKVLTKDYSSHTVNHGVVIGFDPFKKLPTIIVAYMSVSYSGAEIKFLYYNADSKDVEIVVAHDDDEAALDKDMILSKLDAEIAKRQREIQDFEEKKKYFLDKFACYWTPVEEMESVNG